MRYILNNSGYVEEVSNYEIVCNNNTCTEYTGTIPEGYETLEEWALNANVRAYKIVDGNLTYDSEEDTRLQNEWKKSICFEPESIEIGYNLSGSIMTADAFGNVYFKTNVHKNGGTLTVASYTKVCTLPEKARPKEPIYQPCIVGSGTASAMIRISTNGEVHYYCTVANELALHPSVAYNTN